MARTGPQKIPGASLTYFYGTGRYSGSDMEVNCGVAHTTEGRSLPSYNGGAMAPTVTAVPDISAKRLRWYQHFDIDESARTLANKLGGVQTNTANAFQMELVGTCDDRYRVSWNGKRAGVDYIHWPTAPDWALAEIAWLVRWLHQNHRVPLTCVKDWLAYGTDSRRPGITPASYGANPARMSHTAWRNFTGWCGHQHVPENDHGDPGSMNFARVIALAGGATTPPPQEESDMKMSDIVTISGWIKARWKDLADGKISVNTALASGYAHSRAANENTIAILTQLRAQTAAIEKLAQLVGSDVDTAQVVAAVERAIADAVVQVDVDITGADRA
jgi:hypothetical protein